MMHVLGGAIVTAQRKFDIIIKPLKKKKKHSPGCPTGDRLDNTLLQSKKTEQI